MKSFESVCTEVQKVYKRCGFPGIGAVGDTGDEWVFIQAPRKEGQDPNFKPKFVNKQTGKSRVMDYFNFADHELIKNAIRLDLPDCCKK